MRILVHQVQQEKLQRSMLASDRFFCPFWKRYKQLTNLSYVLTYKYYSTDCTIQQMLCFHKVRLKLLSTVYLVEVKQVSSNCQYLDSSEPISYNYSSTRTCNMIYWMRNSKTPIRKRLITNTTEYNTTTFQEEA